MLKGVLVSAVLPAALTGSAIAAPAVQPGLFTGTATPGTTMRLRVTADGHVDFKLRPIARCANGRHRLGVTGPDRPPKLRADGRFSYRESGKMFKHRGTYRYRIAGKVTATAASGTYRGVDHATGAPTCVAKVRWSVKRTR